MHFFVYFHQSDIHFMFFGISLYILTSNKIIVSLIHWSVFSLCDWYWKCLNFYSYKYLLLVLITYLGETCSNSSDSSYFYTLCQSVGSVLCLLDMDESSTYIVQPAIHTHMGEEASLLV